MNEQRNKGDSVTEGLPSDPYRYMLVDKFGMKRGSFQTAHAAGEAAQRIWPGQEQDPDRTGKGWDIQTVGADR